MIILGIDPGTATTGWGIVNASRQARKAKRLELISYDCIVTPKEWGMPKRLSQLRKELKKLLQQAKPDVVCVEEHFFGINARTAITVAQARGVILEAVATARIPIAEHQGLKVKRELTGNGHADKKEVEKAVKKLLAKRVLKKPVNGFLDDSVDGLALAIYHSLIPTRTNI